MGPGDPVAAGDPGWRESSDRPGAGLSALSLNLAIFAVLSGVALIEYGLRETRIHNSATSRSVAEGRLILAGCRLVRRSGTGCRSLRT